MNFLNEGTVVNFDLDLEVSDTITLGVNKISISLLFNEVRGKKIKITLLSYPLEKQDLIRMTDNKNFTPEKANKLKKIYVELQELGLSGTFGSFAIADDDEKELYLMLEKYFTGIEQRKIIKGPFVQ